MTFRDINKINQDHDNITEHSFLVSNRDFDYLANDSMTIALAYDEKKSTFPINIERKESNILNSPFAFNQSLSKPNFEIKLKNVQENEEVENKLSRLSAYAFDDYFKNNDINEIKI